MKPRYLIAVDQDENRLETLRIASNYDNARLEAARLFKIPNVERVHICEIVETVQIP